MAYLVVIIILIEFMPHLIVSDTDARVLVVVAMRMLMLMVLVSQYVIVASDLGGN